MPEVEVVRGDLLDQPVEIIVNAWNRNFIPWWLLLPRAFREQSSDVRAMSRFVSSRRVASSNQGMRGLLAPVGCRSVESFMSRRSTVFGGSSPRIIRTCVTNALRLASTHQFKSIALPLIGAGTGGVPPAAAREVIVEAATQSEFEGRVSIVVLGRGV